MPNQLFTIDQEKCRHDGICAAECPGQLIFIDEKNQLPTAIDRAEKACLRCGHCVAVCPYDAFCLNTMAPEKCTPVDSQRLPDAEQAKLFLTARRSIRTYLKKPVDRATLAEIIDFARYAPTAVNTQPVNWLVFEDPQAVKRLAGLVIDWMRQVAVAEPQLAKTMNLPALISDWDGGKDRICRGAPHLIVAHAPIALASSQSSCTIALTYLELAAFAKGLGACWAGFFHRAANAYAPIQEALQLPNGHQCFGAMLIGYPQYAYHRIPLRKKAAITWR